MLGIVALLLLALPPARVASRGGDCQSPDNPQRRIAATAGARSLERADIVVAQDGSARFRTIQGALDSIPPDNAATRIVLVRNGTYNEKLHITSSHVALVGEDRDRTRIEYAQLRRNWRATHDSDWGAAVINVGDNVTDLVIANLTVHNNYGALHDDHDHQFAIRSGGRATRIALLHANVVADGGDTLSLWNTESGMYYHAACFFEGWVDFVCPRGWCYITDSRFFGHNTPSASIWHDGSRDRDQKLVIRHSRFDGVAGFPLGRNNRDGQFYLLDCLFSRNMADRPIYLASPPDTYQWGERYYYANCHREGGDFGWFADNLEKAPGAPRASDITPQWTFAGRWDPEATMPAVLPFASIPRPRTGTADVRPGGTRLQWVAGRNARTYRLYFGGTNPPPFKRQMPGTTWDTGALRPKTTYYWRVDAVTDAGIIAGPTWELRTADVEGQDERDR